MTRIFLSLALVFCGFFTYGQSQDEPSAYKTQLLPNNPDVANLGKFGDIPINKYNGTANISVPIHAINFEGLSIPIVAKYNTSGITASQEASLIGLGWSLNEGYSITREIQGFEDLNSEQGRQTNVGWIYTPKYLDVQTSYNYQYLILPEDLGNLMESYNNLPHDTEPDLFTVSLPNGSVSFYLPKIQGNETTLTADIINQKNYKVVYRIASQDFEITDPSGFRYVFDVKERSTGFSNSDTPNASSEEHAIAGIPSWSIKQSEKVILTWKLSKITSPLGKELTFSFEDGMYCSYPSFSEKSPSPVGNGYQDFSMESSIPAPLVSVSMTLFQNKYLKKIEGDFGSVEFINSSRLDLFTKEGFNQFPQQNGRWNPNTDGQTTNRKKLDAVVVKDMNGTVVRRADFQYSYFNEDEQNNSSITNKAQYLRLKLDGVSIGDKNYDFEYISPNALPKKDTKAKDFWGFYNGIDNTTRIPTSNRYYLLNINTVINPMRWIFSKSTGANRKSDINYGKIGTLSKVTYPTGGSTEFIYEGNTVSLKKPYHTRTVNNNLLESTSLNSSESYNFRYQYLKLSNDPNYSFYNNVSSNPPTIYEEFEVGGARIRKVVNKDTNGAVLGINEYSYTTKALDNSEKSSGKLMDDLVFTSAGRGNYEYTAEIFNQESGPYANSIGLYLHSNNMIRSRNSAQGSHVGYSEVSHQTTDLGNNSLGKTVSYFTNIENKYLTRDIGVAGYWHGTLSNPPAICNTIPELGVAQSIEMYDFIYQGYDIWQCLSHRLFSYGEVYVIGGAVFAADNTNGSLLKAKVFDTDSKMVQETENVYGTVSIPMPFTFYPKLSYYGPGGAINLNHFYESIYNGDFTVNKVKQLQKTIQKSIFDGKEVVSTTEYFYGSHLMQEKVKSTNSNGEEIIAITKYPQDITTEPYMTSLISQNRFTSPIYQENYKEEDGIRTNLSKTKTVYSYINGRLHPHKLLAAKADRPLEERMIYHKYDIHGNPIELSLKNGSKIYYVWGYNGAHPIAKIDGYTDSGIAAIQNLVNQAIAKSNSDDDTCLDSESCDEKNLRTALNAIRNHSSMANANVTTLTYNPLVGVTSVTDPRGKTAYYHYDANNRLEFVKDNEGKILSKNEYNYKNE